MCWSLDRGLEFALPVGLITGLLFVPYLGSGTGLLLEPLLRSCTPSFGGVLGVWAVFAIGQLLEGMVCPWLVGDRIGFTRWRCCSPVMAFGQVFGFFGVLLALPASAAILVELAPPKTITNRPGSIWAECSLEPRFSAA